MQMQNEIKARSFVAFMFVLLKFPFVSIHVSGIVCCWHLFGVFEATIAPRLMRLTAMTIKFFLFAAVDLKFKVC